MYGPLIAGITALAVLVAVVVVSRRRDQLGLHDLLSRDDARAVSARLDAEPGLVGEPQADGFTLLMIATMEQSPACVDVLLEKGADVDQRDPDGATAMHHAAARGYQDLAERLVAAGADIDGCDTFGVSVLHYAVSGGHVELVRWLLEHGAEKDLKDAAGRSPLDLSYERGDEWVKAVLIDHEARLGRDYTMAEVLAAWPEDKRAAYAFPRAWSLDRRHPALVAATERARSHRDALIEAVRAGRPAGIKVALGDDEGASEAVWATVDGIGEDDVVLARVVTHPAAADPPTEVVRVPAAEVLDWQYEGEDGKVHGAFTDRVTFEAMREEFGFLSQEIEARLASLHDLPEADEEAGGEE